ncbi:MAG: cell division FtsA domain-containing protein, partial [Candidatus Cloacimonadaceae bacterium]|nr:cell division FtsA domain-containing protein [Candidatus Cloacimonadaceae bacterium]
EHFVINHIAVGKALLSEDENKMGCITIDIGGGTCDIALYNRGALRQVFVVPLAGDDITNDLAIGLKTTPTNAEYIKTQYGNANSANVSQEIEIEVEGISGRSAQKKSQYLISQIIQRRVEEILSDCYQVSISKYIPELVTAGIVLSGGTANLKGIESLVSEAFNMNVKTSCPDLSSVTGMISRLEDPAYATVIGLLYHARYLNMDGTGTQFSIPKMKDFKLFDKIKNLLKEI